MKIVCVVGSVAYSYSNLSKQVGQMLAMREVHLLTGGGGGVMAAVSEAFYKTPARKGLVIGVIPQGSVTLKTGGKKIWQPKKNYPNPWVEIPIKTHLDGRIDADGEDAKGVFSRNHINALTADVMIALPGGDGTYAEMELAKNYGKQVIVFLGKSAADDHIELKKKSTKLYQTQLVAAGFQVETDIISVETFLAKNGC